MYRLIFFMLFSHYLFALDIDKKITFIELLPHSQIYIDKTKSITIETVQNEKFQPVTQKILGFGYSPDFNVWIRFTLSNTSTQAIDKIIEYENPLTSHIAFFENTNKLLLKDGLLDTAKDRRSIHPILKITLQPNESKTFYIKASSTITTLIIKLNLWNSDAFYKKEIRYQFILALFFGAMGVIIIYNFIIYLSTREKSYLYYVFAFIGITIHHLLYRGVANLYLLSPEYTAKLIEFSSFIVAIPVFFLALFTKTVLDLKQYPRIYRILNYYLIAFPILIILLYILNLNQYRSLFPVILLFLLFLITLYALLKKNRQAKFVMVGWILFFTSGLFMYLSSLGFYDIFTSFPHYTEFSLIAEAVAFSLLLADRMKQLHEERLTIQNNFIAYQKGETKRLSEIVEEKTSDLEKSLNEKKLLLKELNHRVKNSMQTIISFLRLQSDETEDRKTQIVLQNLENKVFAINDLYALLHTTENISTVSAYDYFSLLINNVHKSFQKPHITIHLSTDININSDDAVYCGFILNEAITNSYQHAFNHTKEGEVFISLSKKNNVYHFTIKDNGIGYTKTYATDTLGMMIIESLATIQLDGEILIDSSEGVEINISWKDNG